MLFRLNECMNALNYFCFVNILRHEEIFNPPSLLRELRRTSDPDAVFLRTKVWSDSPDSASGKGSPELALWFIPLIERLGYPSDSTPWHPSSCICRDMENSPLFSMRLCHETSKTFCRYCNASAMCAFSIFSTPARSAIVLATLIVR